MRLIPIIALLTFTISSYGQKLSIVKNHNFERAYFKNVNSFSINNFTKPILDTYYYGIGPSISAHYKDVNLSIKDGEWITNDAQHDVWQMNLNVVDAKSISLKFQEIEIPNGSFLEISSNKEKFERFRSDDFITREFTSFPLQGDSLNIRVFTPKGNRNNFKLNITQINAAPTGTMDGSCNISVACPEVDNFRAAQKGTVIIKVNGVGDCTGTLVNNTSNDKTPYILTALHCMPFNNNLSNYSFAFNFESKECENDISKETITYFGGEVVASNPISDFALIRLNEEIDPNDDVLFTGWNISETPATNQHVFHHPNGAMKRFSRNDNEVSEASFNNNNAAPYTWRVDKWELGTTEGGSSGSALLNPDALIIGTLVGGNASCNNLLESDDFGRLYLGFRYEKDRSKTLAPWLNPNNISDDEILSLNNSESYNTDIALTFYDGFTAVQCSKEINPMFEIKNNGENLINASDINLSLTIDGNAINDLKTNLKNLEPGERLLIEYETQELSFGDHDISFTVNTNGDEFARNNNFNYSLEVSEFTNEVTFRIFTDEYPSENSLRIIDQQTGEDVVPSFVPTSPSTFEEASFCLKEGCYTLIFSDAAGDGICCGFGEGYFDLISSNGDTLVSGYDGPTNEDVEPEEQRSDFCISVSGISEVEGQTIKLYPNPVSALENVQLENTMKSIVIYNQLGKVVGKYQNANSFAAPNSPGVYIVKTSNKIAKLVVE